MLDTNAKESGGKEQGGKEQGTTIKALEARLHGCHDCAILFRDNVALLTDDSGNLTPEQLLAVLEHLNRIHGDHVQ